MSRMNPARIKSAFLNAVLAAAVTCAWLCPGNSIATAAPGMSKKAGASGFRNLHWGDPPLFQMDRLDRRNGMDVYFLPGDDNRYAGIARASIRYLYRDGGLCRVELDWRKSLDAREYRLLVATLSREWGAPDEALPAAVVWRSGLPGAEAMLTAVDNPATPWTDYDASMLFQTLDCQ